MGTSLQDQVAVVAGGGRGLGRAIAQGLASEGAAVTVTADTPEQLQETAAMIKDRGGQALAVPAHITDSDAVNRVVEATQKSFGPVDILINNAAVGGPSGPIWKQDVEDWRRTLETNVFGQFLITRTVMQEMVERRRGRIINLVSGVDQLKGGFVGLSAYVASQAALCRLTENLAVEARDLGISVFAISLGVVRTDMLDRTSEEPEAELALGGVERLMESATPFQKPVQLCLSMASGRADSLSGSILSVRDDVAGLIGRGDEINVGDLDRLRL